MEYSWQLLFDVALSHGELLRQQTITYDVLLAFLRAAALVGPQTGVYPALLEHLWAQHCVPFQPSYSCVGSTTSVIDVTNTKSKAPDLESTQPLSRPQTTLFTTTKCAGLVGSDMQIASTYERGVVRLTGFTDIMNVVSVRCFQSRKCAHLCEGKDTSLSVALAHSTESCVQLSESVAFTASTYLQDFIDGNIVHKKSCIRLNPAFNNFSDNTKKLVIHVIGALTESVIGVLFDRYATHGRLTYTGYERFVRDVFGHVFNAEQYTSALAIFHFKPFNDANHVVCEAIERYIQRDYDGDGESKNVERTIGFDAFVDALLMLGIVAYADENKYPHHRPITAKIWSVFEDYLCPAAGHVRMAEDPHLTFRLKNVQPYISYIYPDPIQTDRTSSFILGGLAIGMSCSKSITGDEARMPTGSPPLAQPVIRVEGDETVKPSIITGNTVSSTVSSSSPTSTSESIEERKEGLTSEATGDTKLCSIGDQQTLSRKMQRDRVNPVCSSPITKGIQTIHISSSTVNTALQCMPDSVARYAFRLFATEFEEGSVKRTVSGDSKLATAVTAYSGMQECCIYVERQCALCSVCEPGHVLVHLPGDVRDIKYYRWAVCLESKADICAIPCSDSSITSAVTVHLTPLRRVTVSVRNTAGDMTFSSREVLLRFKPTVQTLPAELVEMLCGIFVTRSNTSCACCPSSPLTGDQSKPTIDFATFVDICQQLGLVSHTSASSTCDAALIQYTEMTTLFLQDANSVTSLTARSLECLSFYDFICGIAMIGVQQAHTMSDCPDLRSYLHIALLHHKQQKDSSLTDESGSFTKKLTSPSQSPQLAANAKTYKTGTSMMVSTTPYNALVDVPFANALAQKSRAVQEGTSRREATLTALQINQKNTKYLGGKVDAGDRTTRQQYLLHNGLPDFPHDLSTLSFVSQYEGDAQTSLLIGVRLVSQRLQDAFLTREIVISENIPLPNV